jgi:hypothetical protein
MVVNGRLYTSLHAASIAELHIRIFNVVYLKSHRLYELQNGVPCAAKLKEEKSCGDIIKISSGV